jgi:putative Mg2+ transporter-C (MgtC) family protein
MWEAFRAVLEEEFAAPAPESAARVVVRLLLAVLLGAFIGLEREHRGTAAGLRTHMLLALGVAVILVTALESGLERDALSRVVQGVLAGVGFIGGGAILKEGRREVVKGLTTAASLWASAAIAAAAALGRGLVAVTATVLALVILAVLLHVERVTGLRQRAPER